MTLRTLHALLAAPILCGAALAQPAPRSAPAPEAPRSRAAEPAQRPDEVEVLSRAARVLAARGFDAESRRLVEIIGGMKDRPRPERWRARAGGADRQDRLERGARLLGRPDLEELGTRVRILQLAAAGFAAEGRDPEAEAMRWLTAVGRAQLADEDAPLAPMPASIADREGPVMETLVAIIEEGARLQRRAKRPRLARLQAGLARYYRERDGLEPSRGSRDRRRGADAPGSGRRADEPAAPRPARRLRGLGYVSDPRAGDLTHIEGRAPVLGLAREAYMRDGLDMPPEELERTRGWMDWMANHAALRVARNAGRETDLVERPMPAGGVSGMDELIAMVRGAGKIHDQAGDARKARRCFDLADYYVKRRNGEAPDHSRDSAITPTPPREGAEEGSPRWNLELDVSPDPERVRRRAELEARKARLEAEIARVRARIQEAQAELEKIRAGGDR